MMTRDRPRQQRRLAAECLSLATQVSDPKIRTSLLVMAQRLFDLAERHEQDAGNEALRLRAIHTGIGERLRLQYGRPTAGPYRIVSFGVLLPPALAVGRS